MVVLAEVLQELILYLIEDVTLLVLEIKPLVSHFENGTFSTFFFLNLLAFDLVILLKIAIKAYIQALLKSLTAFLNILTITTLRLFLIKSWLFP